MRLFSNFSENKIRRKVEENLRANYRRSYPAIKRAIKRLVEEAIRNAFNDNQTVQDLRGATDLVAQLGLTDNLQKVAAIRDALTKGLNISVSADKGLLRIRLEVGQKDFSDILGLPAAYQEWTDATGTTEKGPPLPWLEWLLLEGDQPIITNSYFSKSQGTGRTGLPGTMAENRGGKKGWRVPPAYSGIASANFITDIFKKVQLEVSKKLWATVRPVLTRTF